MKKLTELFFLLFFSLYFFVPVLAEEKLINVLCYHRFKERKSDNKKKQVIDSYSIKINQFEEQMKYLKENGYNVISIQEFIDYMYGKGDLPEKPVLITIDDGYKCIYEYAYPVLKKYKYPAVVYLYQVFTPGGKSALSIDEIKELKMNGFDFGCHSNTHPVLTKKNGMNDEEYINFLKKEIIEPKNYLEKKLGFPIETFAYPYGSYSKEVHFFIKKAGYKLAFSVVPSYNTKETDKYSLKRTMIYSSTTIDEFKEILEKKQLKLKEFYPEDGSVIEEQRPVLKAQILEDSYLNTETIKFKMGRVVLKDSIYNPELKMLTYSYTENKSSLPRGTHNAKVIALSKDGKMYEYAWSFIIGKPLKINLSEESQ